jgi:hypothetical protein
MARSEHATRRDPARPSRSGDLDRKRRIKRLVDVERARPRGAPGHGDAAGIPITTRDDGPYVHYPAGADDLRAILARVPHGTADGLGDQAEQAPRVIQVAFACALHYGTHYDEALAILDHVDRTYPEDLRARVLRADIYVHQERYSEAEPVVARVLAEAPDDTDALEVLGDIAHARGQWSRLREIAARRSAWLTPGGWEWCDSEQLDLHALLELGELDAVEGKLAALFAATEGQSFAQRRLRAIEAVVRVHQRRYADALAIAAMVAPPLDRAVVAAVTFEASHHLGLPCDLEVGRAVLEPLRRLGYVTWVERLRAITDAAGPTT